MARIAIDLARRIGHVDRRIYGNFIEHLGRCIYGGVVEHPDRVGVRETRRPAAGSRLEPEFPAYSVSVLRVRVAG